MNVVYRDPLVITYFNFVTLNYQKILWSDGCVFYSPTSSPGSSRFPPRLFAPDSSSNIRKLEPIYTLLCMYRIVSSFKKGKYIKSKNL